MTSPEQRSSTDVPAVPAPVQPIESLSMPDRVTIELRRAILAGRLAPGSTFSLREVADMLNVSFIPVREALRNLESEGLVTTRPGRSAMVTKLDLVDLQSIYRLRRLIEPDLARRSCCLLDDEELDRLERTAKQFGFEDRGMDAIYEDHHAFHQALFAPAATSWDLRILTTLWRAAERYIRIGFGALDAAPDEHDRRVHAHAELVAVFRRRDADLAAKAVQEHLERNEATALRALDGIAG
jgi:DNA-binding GntR family transcriptional regulator